MKKSIVLALAILAASCQQDKEKFNKAEKEVFAIHDEVMPKMDQIVKLRSEVSKEITTLDSLLNLKNDEPLQQRKATALEISSLLLKADEGMMGWMRAYNRDSLMALPSDEALKALEVEKTKITEVRNLMLESIEKAETFLKKD
ncbi:MAG: viral A-type inclusion protein [Runella sp.]